MERGGVERLVEVVEADERIAARGEPRRQMRADEAGHARQ